MVRFILVAVMLGLLAAFVGDIWPTGLMPSGKLVRSAIAIQVNQTQEQLAEQLNNSSPKLAIEHLRINQQEPLKIHNLLTYHVRGTYDLTIQQQDNRVTEQKKPFDVYLQRQIEGKTWRLLLPQSTEKNAKPTWLTYLVR